MGIVNTFGNSTNITFDKGLQDYMNAVYKNTGIGIFISGIIAMIIGNNPNLMAMFFSNALIRILIMFSPLIFSMYFAAKVWSLSPDKAKNMFFIFSGLMGISLSTIFVVYTRYSIYQTFLTTAITFGIMSLYGYKTKKDLTSLGSFLMMGVIGMLIASIINMFLKSSSTDLVISIIGVIIFTLFTAYDVQNIKGTYDRVGVNSDITEKMAVFGAFQLYLDFINLFTYLLRFIGDQNRD